MKRRKKRRREKKKSWILPKRHDMVDRSEENEVRQPTEIELNSIRYFAAQLTIAELIPRF